MAQVLGVVPKALVLWLIQYPHTQTLGIFGGFVICSSTAFSCWFFNWQDEQNQVKHFDVCKHNVVSNAWYMLLAILWWIQYLVRNSACLCGVNII